MRLGEIWNVELPPSYGREQTGRRPALIVQDGAVGDGSPLVVVVPLSSRIGAARFPSSVVVESDETNGLAFRSVAMGFQLRAFDRDRFLSRLGAVSEVDFAKIQNALRSLMAL